VLAKWRALKDAAGLSIELQDCSNRMRSWVVGQVPPPPGYLTSSASTRLYHRNCHP